LGQKKELPTRISKRDSPDPAKGHTNRHDQRTEGGVLARGREKKAKQAAQKVGRFQKRTL